MLAFILNLPLRGMFARFNCTLGKSKSQKTALFLAWSAFSRGDTYTDRRHP